MNLRETILKDYKSIYDFSKKKNLQNQKVYYWCNKNWEELTFKTRNKIIELLK